jgi:hypothetical protein
VPVSTAFADFACSLVLFQRLLFVQARGLKQGSPHLPVPRAFYPCPTLPRQLSGSRLAAAPKKGATYEVYATSRFCKIPFHGQDYLVLNNAQTFSAGTFYLVTRVPFKRKLFPLLLRFTFHPSWLCMTTSLPYPS